MKMFGRAKINVNLLIFLLNKKFYGKQIATTENNVHFMCAVNKRNSTMGIANYLNCTQGAQMSQTAKHLTDRSSPQQYLEIWTVQWIPTSVTAIFCQPEQQQNNIPLIESINTATLLTRADFDGNIWFHCTCNSGCDWLRSVPDVEFLTS